MSKELLWIEAGRRFRPEELVFWQARGRQALSDVSAGVDTLVLGPHASAAFPAELRPHISPALSLRKQRARARQRNIAAEGVAATAPSVERAFAARHHGDRRLV